MRKIIHLLLCILFLPVALPVLVAGFLWEVITGSFQDGRDLYDILCAWFHE